MKRFFLLLIAVFLTVTLSAQEVIRRPHPIPPPHPPPGHWRPIITPSFPMRNAVCKIDGVDADVSIRKGIATTQLDIRISNPSNQRLEAEMLLPLPNGAVVRGFDFAGKAAESQATLMQKEEVLRKYREIVAQMRDPAILEFVNNNLLRTAVFPVEPNGKQKIRIVYEQVLKPEFNRCDYVLPRSEAPDFDVPWNITVRIEDVPPSEPYSPSHELVRGKEVPSGKTVLCVAKDSTKNPGSFLLSYPVKPGSPMTFLYPDPANKGGFFMIAGNLPEIKNALRTHKQSLILVLDRSGSMRGPIIKQVREAAKQAIGSLQDGDFFNIITYNEAIELFAKDPVAKNDASEKAAHDFLDRMTSAGGTNIHDALVEAVRMPAPRVENLRQTILFLTDGVPTIGQTSEAKIRDVAANVPARIFCFGVGVDVNVPLLDKLAQNTAGRSVYVLPNESVEVRMAAVTGKLSKHPWSMTLQPKGSMKLSDCFPSGKMELYDGEPFVILGRYCNGDAPNESRASLVESIPPNAKVNAPRAEFVDSPILLRDADASTVHAFVPRLWAARRIAILSDGVRELGLNGLSNPNDPKLKELLDEIIRLSLEYGILTEYTAFFAGEGAISAEADVAKVQFELQQRAMAPAVSYMSNRAGKKAVAHSFNMEQLRRQKTLNVRNDFHKDTLEATSSVDSKNIRQMNNQSFVRNSRNQWTQGSLVVAENAKAKEQTRQQNITPKRTIRFGTEEYDKALVSLAKQNRQNALALQGDLLLELDGEPVLIQNNIP